MSKPQSPELRRTGRNPALDPDNAATRLEATPDPDRSGPEGPVPPENRPGHQPDQDQDRPDPDAFVARFNAGPAGPDEDRGDAGSTSAGRDTARRLGQAAARGVTRGRRVSAGALRRAASALDPG